MWFLLRLFVYTSDSEIDTWFTLHYYLLRNKRSLVYAREGGKLFLACHGKKSLSESFPNNRSLLKSLVNATEVFHSLR